MTLIERTKQAWADAGLTDITPAHIQSPELLARQLEDELSRRFKPYIQQWQDGLISASELYAQIVLQANS